MSLQTLYLHFVSFGKVEQSFISKEPEYVTLSMPLACCCSSGTDTSTSLPTLRKMQSKLQYLEVTYNHHRDYIFYNNVTLHSSIRKLWHDHIVNTCLSGNKTKRCWMANHKGNPESVPSISHLPPSQPISFCSIP